ncbi:hypothetical protein I302_106289 [Kwoniella bestiolae CBS 10118]|uniref:Uncharacterized protein n=1 Tax=Kwoniella bestiolae CBS 10118 TaxID=1296100 RepID=A0A1B9G3K1_9TREE|nr:hypothetical protein I302_05413 [Kwoniella bestiolae CBS 10118]OCF25593.1 hypothetical protein I302_05413 [Kwoniella bestiolae CBS 10118]
MPLNSEVVLTAISESIIEYMERKISPEMLKASKQGWDDRCKLRTVGEIEHSLTVPFGERNRYQPNTQTHARHVSTMNLSLPPSRLQHMIDVRVKRADEAKIRLNKAAALAPNRLISLSDDDFATANEEIESRLDSYMVMNKPMDIAQVVNSQSHLSEEEWREHGDLFGAFYRKTLNNGEKTLENFFQDCKQGFASMDHPPQLSFWISKGDPSANSEKITIPDADTFEETAKSVGMFRARGEPFSVWEGLSDRGF